MIESLAEGEVATYGEIAADAGRPGAARAVGRILASSDGLPWWRVVTKEGRLVPGLEAEHAVRLAREGLAVRHNRVVRPCEAEPG
jgi:methylated-DNA-protein-cysteine methyltransferase-like protein